MSTTGADVPITYVLSSGQKKSSTEVRSSGALRSALADHGVDLGAAHAASAGVGSHKDRGEQDGPPS